MTELQLDVFVYGPEQKRLEVDFCPTVPPHILGGCGQTINEWAMEWASTVIMDVKHTENWKCEMCSELMDIYTWY